VIFPGFVFFVFCFFFLILKRKINYFQNSTKKNAKFPDNGNHRVKFLKISKHLYYTSLSGLFFYILLLFTFSLLKQLFFQLFFQQNQKNPENDQSCQIRSKSFTMLTISAPPHISFLPFTHYDPHIE